jgi:hypothetical protein
MSRRTSIVKAFIEHLKTELNGTQPDKYYTTLYGNASYKVFKFEEIQEFPYIGVQTGSESYQYMPSRQKWNFLGISVFLYAKDEEDVQQQLEYLIEDIKTIVDSEYEIPYTVTKPDGSELTARTTEMSMISTDTDEGIFKPYGFAEVQITIKYAADRRIYD